MIFIAHSADEGKELLSCVFSKVALEELSDISIVNPGTIGGGRYDNVKSVARAYVRIEVALHGETCAHEGQSAQPAALGLLRANFDDAEERNRRLRRELVEHDVSGVRRNRDEIHASAGKPPDGFA